VHNLNQRLLAAVALALSCGYDLAEERYGCGRCCARRTNGGVHTEMIAEGYYPKLPRLGSAENAPGWSA